MISCGEGGVEGTGLRVGGDGRGSGRTTTVRNGRQFRAEQCDRFCPISNLNGTVRLKIVNLK